MVCCPHYLCELVAWAGVCVVFNHAVALGIMSFFLLYLLGRSRATLRWYHDKMERKIPQRWFALVPLCGRFVEGNEVSELSSIQRSSRLEALPVCEV